MRNNFPLFTLLVKTDIVKHVQFLYDCSRKLFLVLEKQLKNKLHEKKLLLVVALHITVFCRTDSKNQVYLYCSVFKNCQSAISCAYQEEILLFAEIK